jgi:hypothetical protein
MLIAGIDLICDECQQMCILYCMTPLLMFLPLLGCSRLVGQVIITAELRQGGGGGGGGGGGRCEQLLALMVVRFGCSV